MEHLTTLANGAMTPTINKVAEGSASQTSGGAQTSQAIPSEEQETYIAAFKRIKFDSGLLDFSVPELIRLIDEKRDTVGYPDIELPELFGTLGNKSREGKGKRVVYFSWATRFVQGGWKSSEAVERYRVRDPLSHSSHHMGRPDYYNIINHSPHGSSYHEYKN